MSFNEDNDNSVMHMGQIEIDATSFNKAVDEMDLPVLPTRNLVLFPGVTIPINITRESSLTVARRASEEKIPVGVICQVDPSEENPNVTKGLYKYGVTADIFKVFELPDGSHTAIIHARKPFRVLGRGAGVVLPEAGLHVRIKEYEEVPSEKTDMNFDVTMSNVVDLAAKVMEMSTPLGKEFDENIRRIESPEQRINFIASNLPFSSEEKISMLALKSYPKRAEKLLSYLMAAHEKATIGLEIIERAKAKMNENQRSAFLQMQLDSIKEELYGDPAADSDDFQDLTERAEKTAFPDDVRQTFTKELGKLRRLNPQTPDYSVQYSYLETLLDVPWGKTDPVTGDINSARDILEHDHYGLDKIKRRILEQIAVVMHSKRAKAPILCLVGPPGVGKTSLGKSIARAMGRKYQRVSLGGLHDEAEIRGHRRTYIGAMPGRIMKAVKSAGSMNPVLMLDEIDKLGKDYKGDPSAALLEVLDPEQNKAFHDNYIDVDFNLSDVLFIATANSLSGVERPLLDRMEVIDLSGYLIEEKMEIARRHLIPRIFADNDVAADEQFSISDAGLEALIEKYTSESGVRQLEKQLSSLVRKSILARLGGETFPAQIEPDDLLPILGLAPYSKDKYEGNEFTGVVTGLAWTQVGGEILLAEASISHGKNESLTITGNLGDVMKESATIAYQWVKAHAADVGIAPDAFEAKHLHIHFPEGAIPKDGPSAGITIATAIASAFSGRKVAESIAMTGELTLRGKVLPVGGIKEKILAAKRAGINTIILSKDNERDIEDIPEKYRIGLRFIYVSSMSDVIENALK